jgi:hypothetical protein
MYQKWIPSTNGQPGPTTYTVILSIESGQSMVEIAQGLEVPLKTIQRIKKKWRVYKKDKPVLMSEARAREVVESLASENLFIPWDEILSKPDSFPLWKLKKLAKWRDQDYKREEDKTVSLREDRTADPKSMEGHERGPALTTSKHKDGTVSVWDSRYHKTSDSLDSGLLSLDSYVVKRDRAEAKECDVIPSKETGLLCFHLQGYPFKCPLSLYRGRGASYKPQPWLFRENR